MWPMEEDEEKVMIPILKRSHDSCTFETLAGHLKD